MKTNFLHILHNQFSPGQGFNDSFYKFIKKNFSRKKDHNKDNHIFEENNLLYQQKGLKIKIKKIQIQ